MKNNIILSNKEAPRIFKEYFLDYLGTNLSNNLCESTAQLLAIDYSERLESNPELKEYINLCILRIKKHLGMKVMTDESFSSVMTLFTIAITNEKEMETDDNSKSQEKSQNALIDSIIATDFPDLSPDEISLIKLYLKELLNNKNGKEIINNIRSNPKLFYSIVIKALREKIQTAEIIQLVKHHMSNLSLKKKKRKVIKNLISKVSLVGGLMAAASAGLIVSGLMLPAIIIPSAIAAIKISPILGEKVINTIDRINKPTKTTESITTNLTQTNKNTIIEKTKEIKISFDKLAKNKIKDIIKNFPISKNTTEDQDITISKKKQIQNQSRRKNNNKSR